MTSCNLGNWSSNSESIVNTQIGVEFGASYQYDLLWCYFDSSEVGLKNIAKFFKKSAEEEREHAHKLMEYQNLRGGIVKLDGISAVNLDFLKEDEAENDVLMCFQKALQMEQSVYESLLRVHKVAEEENDPQFADFIEGQYLEEQVEAINEITKYVSQLKRIGNDGHGLWNFDREFEN